MVFVVPSHCVQRAIGKDNSNLKKLGNILGKRTRVLEEPDWKKDLKRFIEVLVSPIQFNEAEIKENENGVKEVVITTPGRESRAMLIGRNRMRETEMKSILEQYFGVKELKIA